MNGQKKMMEFILSGYYQADKNMSMSGMVFVSKKFAEENISFVASEVSKANGSYVNTTNLYVMFSNSFGIEDKMKKIPPRYSKTYTGCVIQTKNRITREIDFLMTF